MEKPCITCEELIDKINEAIEELKKTRTVTVVAMYGALEYIKNEVIENHKNSIQHLIKSNKEIENGKL